jgi:hypothetical protein
MEQKTDQLDRAVILLNAKLLGIVLGFLSGAVLFLVTIFLVLKAGPHVGEHLNLLSNFFPGYQVTLLGSIIGFFYGFVVGFLTGAVLGAVYNRVAKA